MLIAVYMCVYKIKIIKRKKERKKMDHYDLKLYQELVEGGG